MGIIAVNEAKVCVTQEWGKTSSLFTYKLAFCLLRKVAWLYGDLKEALNNHGSHELVESIAFFQGLNLLSDEEKVFFFHSWSEQRKKL